MLQVVAVCCSGRGSATFQGRVLVCRVLQLVAVQCVAVCCRMSQCVAVVEGL